jgi:hypothetical protein
LKAINELDSRVMACVANVISTLASGPYFAIGANRKRLFAVVLMLAFIV